LSVHGIDIILSNILDSEQIKFINAHDYSNIRHECNGNMIKSNQEIIKYSDSVPYHINDIDWKTFDKIIEKYDLQDNIGYSSIKSGMISIVFKLKKKNSDDFLILKMLEIK
jgi:hypothetical protein